LKRQGRAAAKTAQLDPRLDYILALNADALDQNFSILQSEIQLMFVSMKERWAKELESS
jgi:RNase P protein component